MRVRRGVIALLSGILIVLMTNSCIFGPNNFARANPTPDYHFHCELGDKVYDMDWYHSVFYTTKDFAADCDVNYNGLDFCYHLKSPVSFYIRVGLDAASCLVNRKQYYSTKGEIKKGDYNYMSGIIEQYDVESCSFSFELPESTNGDLVYSFLFEMDLSNNSGHQQIRNGKITFYKHCPGVESFVQKIKIEE